MRLVVSDATPINVLVRIGLIRCLADLFEVTAVPPAVVAELSHPNTPALVREWISAPPVWLQVRAPASVDSTLTGDPGEREAIALARELHAEFLLVDDRRARAIAKDLGLNVLGTVGLLERTSERGLITLREAFERLRATDFRVSDAVIEEALARDANR